MNVKDIRKIRQIADLAFTQMLNIYEKEIPDELYNNDTFEYFYMCILHRLNSDLVCWKTDSLMEKEK